jgi:hypothetical protein
MFIGRIFFFILMAALLSACTNNSSEVELKDEDRIMSYDEDPIEDFDGNEEEPIKKTVPPKNDIKSMLTFLESYDYFEHEDIDVDSLSYLLSKKITKLLRNQTLNSRQLDSIGLNLTVDKPNLRNLKIYDFNFHSGGTRGYISHPIIQWLSDDGKLCSYNFATKINCGIYSIYQLESIRGEHYLMLGQETGSGACMQNIAYCIEIKDSTLIADNIYFVNRPFINLCNVELEFDEENQILIGSSQVEELVNLRSDVTNQGVFSEDENDNSDLIDLMDGLYFAESKKMHLFYNGREFEKAYEQ